MCHLHKYLETVSSGCSDRRGALISALEGYQPENALSRLKAVKAALSNLKIQLSRNQALNLKDEIDRAIARLETAPKTTVLPQKTTASSREFRKGTMLKSLL